MAYTKILVPFDGSVFSMRAFKAALGIAKRKNSVVHVLTCLEKGNLGAWYIDKRINKKILKDAKDFAKKSLSRLEKLADNEGVEVSIHIQEAKSIAKEIISFSDSKKMFTSQYQNTQAQAPSPMGQSHSQSIFHYQEPAQQSLPAYGNSN